MYGWVWALDGVVIYTPWTFYSLACGRNLHISGLETQTHWSALDMYGTHPVVANRDIGDGGPVSRPKKPVVKNRIGAQAIFCLSSGDLPNLRGGLGGRTFCSAEMLDRKPGESHEPSASGGEHLVG